MKRVERSPVGVAGSALAMAARGEDRMEASADVLRERGRGAAQSRQERIGMNFTKMAAVAAFLLLPGVVAAEITFYEYEGFRGRSFSATEDVRNFERHGFNDKAQSVVVGSGRWQVCSDSRFEGECRVLRRGSYDNLRSLDMNKRISSVRRVEGSRDAREVPPPMAEPNYAYHRRPREQVFEARVLSVREVHGTAERHCWTETEPATSTPSGSQVGAALVGAVIGGVLGHQIGGGRGKDAATAAGAVAGAAIGNRASGGGSYGSTYQREVRRCETRGGKPAYWDVRYEFDGEEHSAQMSAPPGRTILVNEYGEPRQ
jgi:uncharacterized protein YcfJ